MMLDLRPGRARLLRRGLLVAGLVAALVVPASALAQEPNHASLDTQDVNVSAAVRAKKKKKKKKKHRRSVTSAQSVKNPPVGGWKFALGVTQNDDGTDTLFLNLARKTGNATESHSYSFKLTGDAFTIATDLSSAKLNTGTQLGAFGTINMTFGNAA